VISAVGHETDVTIADFVADLRAPTPSAAAEILSQTHEEILERIRGWKNQLTRGMRHRLDRAAYALQKRGVERVAGMLGRGVGRKLQKIDDYEYRLKTGIRARLERAAMRQRSLENRLRRRDQRLQLERAKGQVEAGYTSLRGVIKVRIAKRRERLEILAAALKQLSPVKVLERGYAVVFDADGRLLKDAAAVKVGANINVRLAAGKLDAKVTRNQSQSE